MQENKTVFITMITTQKVEDHRETQKAELEGTLWVKEGAVHLIYEEGGSKTHLRIQDKLVHIHRLGELSGNLWFVEGEERDTRYETPYGRMMLTIHTHRIRWDAKKLNLAIRYNILVEGQLASMNEMTIEMKENVKE
ncbi:MAG: DUF1934 domain-containing protein [Clostridia bacterium]|nr:DUF1934 domain-containing protein [Clostridia bacterium]